MAKPLTNSDLAELLAREAENNSGILARAFRRAARSAFLWPEEAVELMMKNRPLTELRSVGPFIGKQIRRWIEKPPRKITTPPLIRRDFIALVDARKVLRAKPEWSRNLRGDLQ